MTTLKRQSESMPITLGFVNRTGANTLTLVSVKAYDELAEGADVSSIMIAASPAPAVSGQNVVFWVQNGTAGHRYRIEIQVSRSADGAVFAGEAYLDVTTDL